MKKNSDRENFDIINTHLRLRVIKSGAEYLLRKDKEINQFLSKSKKTFIARFL